MKQNAVAAVVLSFSIAVVAPLVALSAAGVAPAQDAKTPYPKMAPVEQYRMERDAEIALARSAAPDSIAKDAEVMVMGRHGYEVAVKGTNGFMCMVERGWTAPADNPDFWNPKLRGPICFNPAAIRTYVPQTIMKTKLILAGRTKEQMMAEITAALDKKELPQQELGAMSYMLSKDGYLGDGNGHWHPHLMFFLPIGEKETWGANQAGSPIYEMDDTLGRMTVYLVPVGKWSDGTAAH